MQARDSDSGENSELVYSLETADRFSVEPHSGLVLSTASFLGQVNSPFYCNCLNKNSVYAF